MSVETPEIEPTEIRAGDTITWLKTVDDYLPADGWTLKYAFRAASAKFNITCTTSGTKYLATILPATSAAFTVGRYTWIAYVTKGAGATLEQHTVDKGSCTVLPCLSTDANYDARTDARIIYDSLIAAYKTYVSSQGQVDSYSIGGRSMKFRSTTDILDQIKHWAAIVANEEAEEKINNGQGTGRKILYQF